MSPPSFASLAKEQPNQLNGVTVPFDVAMTSDVVAKWHSLVSSGQHAQPFYQPEWFLAFSRSFAVDRPKLLTIVTDGDRLLGVLPLMRRGIFFGRIPARALSSLSGIHSCRFDFITEPSARSEVAAAAWRRLAEDESWDVIEAFDVPQHGSFEDIVACARDDGFLAGSWPTRRSPVLRIPPKGVDPFSNCPKRSRQFRNRLAKKLQKLGERGKVSFKVDDSSYEEGLARFLLLESSGWKGANRSAIASNVQSTGFYSSVVELLQGRRQLKLYSLCLDQKPISMHLGLMHEGIYYCPKVAYDEAFGYFAPGHLLVQHIIGDLAANGGHTFDFLGSRSLWKAVWASEVTEHRNWYIFRPNLRGKVLYSLTMRLAPRIRSLRHRMRGDPQALVTADSL